MTTKSTTENIFDQAADTFVSALKNCVHLQDEMTKKCFSLVKEWGEAGDWAKSSQNFMGQAMPNMQKAAEESMKLWEQNAAKSMELLSEGFATAQTTSAPEAQEKLKKLWEQSLDAMRENTENMVKLSSESMQAYADFMKEQLEGATATAAAG